MGTSCVFCKHYIGHYDGNVVCVLFLSVTLLTVS